MYNNADEKYGVCNSADEWWQIDRVAWALRISFLLSFICRNDNYLRSGRFIRMRFAFCEFAHNLATSHCHCDRVFFTFSWFLNCSTPVTFTSISNLQAPYTLVSSTLEWVMLFHGKSFFTNEFWKNCVTCQYFVESLKFPHILSALSVANNDLQSNILTLIYFFSSPELIIFLAFSLHMIHINWKESTAW